MGVLKETVRGDYRVALYAKDKAGYYDVALEQSTESCYCYEWERKSPWRMCKLECREDFDEACRLFAEYEEELGR